MRGWWSIPIVFVLSFAGSLITRLRLWGRLWRRQRGVFYDMVEWIHPGCCPDCGSRRLIDGPRGGAAVNRYCVDCGARWNTLRLHRGGLIQRIG